MSNCQCHLKKCPNCGGEPTEVDPFDWVVKSEIRCKDCNFFTTEEIWQSLLRRDEHTGSNKEKLRELVNRIEKQNETVFTSSCPECSGTGFVFKVAVPQKRKRKRKQATCESLGLGDSMAPPTDDELKGM